MAHKAAEAALERFFGYSSFRPAQEVPVASLLAGQDILAIMPTGAGKSICFQIPALLRQGLTIVFSPLISLMQDQVEGLRLQHIPAAYMNSTLEQDQVVALMRQLRAGRIKLLYLAPERLGSEYFQNFLCELPISQVIIDEAHCVSQWGHDFRPSYQLIGPFIERLPKRPVVGAFTASATQEVERDMKRLLGLTQARVHITGFDRPNLAFSVVQPSRKLPYVLQFVEAHKDENGVIYCSTRKDVEKIYGELIKHGYEAGYYHAGLSDEVRKLQQERYAYDKVKIMVATSAFGMGIDKSNVRYVLHYQMPRNMESYYQEAGRAGRDGGPAVCVLLYSGRDVMIHKYLINESVHEPARQRIEMTKLQQMINYCFTTDCLRKYMLNYFGEQVQWTRCDNCSSCKNKGQLRDLTKEAKYIFKAIVDTEERYGAAMIADIVAGNRTDRIVKYGYDRLPVFGALRDMDDKDIKGLIRQFVSLGYLHCATGKYPILSIEPAGEAVLEGEATVQEVRRQVVTVREEPYRTAGAGGMAKQWAAQRSRGGKKSLFDVLREHRKKLSEIKNVPPYLIFPDTVLIDMASTRPRTLADLSNIKGVGDAKLQEFGLSFLAVISQYK
ncbi:DNA helicase RecQ [uncultured Veillonella sp.]|uniref:DNA helicase RecQ n=1 Tax=uncultured Veillonella sp. TaxID=159268 RepID=UPI0025DA69E0|nr:DNA helicase RecQ [uncultured Veillonella sp.]